MLFVPMSLTQTPTSRRAGTPSNNILTPTRQIYADLAISPIQAELAAQIEIMLESEQSVMIFVRLAALLQRQETQTQGSPGALAAGLANLDTANCKSPTNDKVQIKMSLMA
ncbi:hypothetical protein PTTG_00732 [Puccinia triticina 1-1 BBBD Race 1]|uniref:Uncharacterized protein n=1 Tax=Puccinia triticina (isolate 1-1 / race 1 (BBBD)) TaxID=630390 RepID=A0A0C4EJ15_PUCT1|nr:hypothetical protein PTTG_00732 [Puccinia triticina 1-1 BBBD Race 1]